MASKQPHRSNNRTWCLKIIRRLFQSYQSGMIVHQSSMIFQVMPSEIVLPNLIQLCSNNNRTWEIAYWLRILTIYGALRPITLLARTKTLAVSSLQLIHRRLWIRWIWTTTWWVWIQCNSNRWWCRDNSKWPWCNRISSNNQEVHWPWTHFSSKWTTVVWAIWEWIQMVGNRWTMEWWWTKCQTRWWATSNRWCTTKWTWQEVWARWVTTEWEACQTIVSSNFITRSGDQKYTILIKADILMKFVF